MAGRSTQPERVLNTSPPLRMPKSFCCLAEHTPALARFTGEPLYCVTLKRKATRLRVWLDSLLKAGSPPALFAVRRWYSIMQVCGL